MEELRSQWTNWQSHPNADIDSFLMFCRLRPEVVRPHVLVVHRGGVPDAIIVGRLEDATVGMAVGYFRLIQIRARRLAFNHGGFLGRATPENCEVVVREIVRSLKGGTADFAFFSHLRVDSPLFTIARTMPALRSRDYASKAHVQTHRSMSVPPGIDQLYRRFPGSVRSELRRKAKKLVREFSGSVQIRTFPDGVDLDAMFRDIEEVARTTYQRGLGVGFEDTPEMRAGMALLAEKGRLRAHVLYIQEKPCAFWIGIVYRGVFHGAYIGYDRAFGKYSPGMFLAMKVIEDLCELRGSTRVREIDWGLGDAGYKESLSDKEWKEGSVSIFAPTWKGLRLNLALTAPAVLEGSAKRLLSNAGLLQKVKTAWRKRLGQRR